LPFFSPPHRPHSTTIVVIACRIPLSSSDHERRGGEVNNRYALRNSDRNNQAREEEKNDEAEELGSDGEEEEEGRDRQRRRVNEAFNEDFR